MLENRIRQLNKASVDSQGKVVVYVMSRDQRLQDNHALVAAQRAALKRKLPLIIIFNFVVHSNRSREHYQFMVDGLRELEASAKKLSIPVLFWHETEDGLERRLNSLDPAAVYFDFSPLKGPRSLHSKLAKKLDSLCYEVDTHNIIPAWLASDHQEFAAHTFRPKVHKQLADYLELAPKLVVHPHSSNLDLNIQSIDSVIKHVLPHIRPSGVSIDFQPGEAAAHKHLQSFIRHQLADYAHLRNDPSKDAVSGLSPYLHFGHLSSLRVALEVIEATKTEPLLIKEARLTSPESNRSDVEGMNTLLEELIVRKELSDNFCLHAKSYRDFSSVPAWARSTLQEHLHDKREFTYNREQWEAAATHDPAWNAAQLELLTTGKMHGYMRMYWAKKILEWSTNPEEALADCIYLNDKYSTDGGDPNGYVGILWSIAGLHDRPWTERQVFGKIRYMNYPGLKRKFDIESYIQRWNQT